MLGRREQLSCQMLGKCVWEMWVTTVTWMGGQTNFFASIFGVCALAASPTEVALCPLWKHDPLRCVHALWTSARKKAGGWRPGAGVGKRPENERTVEKRSGLQAFLCDYTSVEKEARHSFSQCLKLLTSTLDPCAKKLSCERFIWWLTAFPNSEARRSLNLATFVLAFKVKNLKLVSLRCEISLMFSTSFLFLQT